MLPSPLVPSLTLPPQPAAAAARAAVGAAAAPAGAQVGATAAGLAGAAAGAAALVWAGYKRGAVHDHVVQLSDEDVGDTTGDLHEVARADVARLLAVDVEAAVSIDDVVHAVAAVAHQLAVVAVNPHPGHADVLR